MDATPHHSRSKLVADPPPEQVPLAQPQQPDQGLERAYGPTPSPDIPHPVPDPQRVAMLLARLAVRRYLQQKEQAHE